MIELTLPPRPLETVPIVIDGPFSASYQRWQVRAAQPSLVVIVKTTLDIHHDAAATPRDEQDPLTGDVHYDEDLGASLRYASDFAPLKRRADVTLVGHAQPQLTETAAHASVLNVQLVFGRALTASLAAIGERTWSSGHPSKPRPITAPIPLRYERAFGGPGYRDNPLGVGLIDGGASTRLPSLERVDKLIRAEGDRPSPACLAPRPTSMRGGIGGTYDEAWLRSRWPYFPDDFDYTYYNAAPISQQIDYPLGDEAFRLAGVHPDLRVISGRLPGLVPVVFAQLDRAHQYKFRQVPVRLDTVHFDADAMTVTLVWRGLLDVTEDRAPEVISLFVGTSAVGSTADADAAQGRYFELTGAGAAVGGAASPEAAENDTAPAPSSIPSSSAASREDVVASLAAGAALAGAMLDGCDLSGVDLAGRDLRGASMIGAQLDGANLAGADLRDAVLTSASARSASFRGADLRHANLAEASLHGADFSGAAMEGASLAEVDATAASFASADLAHVGATDARFEDACLDDATADSADFSGATFSRASMLRAKLDDCLFYDVIAEECRFDEASLIRFRADGAKLARSSFARSKAAESTFQEADLSGASFAHADLTEAVFTDANLEAANLTHVLAARSRFRHASLRGVHAMEADFMEANFEAADLTKADLRGSSLHGAETLSATLHGVKLDGAILTSTKLGT